jgi:hypothetical protein
MSNNGQHTGSSHETRSQRNRTIALVAVVGVAALALGLYLGSRGDQGTPVASSSSATPSPSDGASPTVEPEPSDEPSSETPPVSSLEDGEHFVQAKEVEGSEGDQAVVVDLGYLLSGDAANEAAAEDGVETPVPNDYYIVNDNPKLRTVPLSRDATVEYIPTSTCCDLEPWDLQTWVDVVNGDVQSDMMGEMSYTWWWITVEDGEIVAVEQQYFP